MVCRRPARVSPPTEAHSILPFTAQLLADVFIFTDHMSGRASGLSPGYGVALVAETTSGRMLCAEACAELGKASQSTAEDVGRAAAAALLEEVSRGGVADSMHQALVLTLCVLGPEEINEVRLGPLTPYAGALRNRNGRVGERGRG